MEIRAVSHLDLAMEPMVEYQRVDSTVDMSYKINQETVVEILFQQG